MASWAAAFISGSVPRLAGGLAKAPARQARRPERAKQFRVAAGNELRPGETPEQAMERRQRESERVEERVVHISSVHEFERELAKAGTNLVVVEVQSEEVCQTGWAEEPELHWKDDRKKALEPCYRMKHVFLRTARDCVDIEFLAVDADSEDGQDLCDHLGIDVLPTLQFYRGGHKVWEHRGVSQMDQDLGEGVLYFGDSAAAGVKASSYVTDIHSRAELEEFIQRQPERVLTVVDISLTSAAPCVRIFPAVLALAKNFGPEYAAFARLLGDESPELQEVMRELNIVEVPTFLFYRNGEYLGRHVGSSRADLIGQILEQQAKLGIAPPQPAGGTPRRSIRRAKASRS